MLLIPVTVDDVVSLDAYVDLVEACAAVDGPPGAPLTRHALHAHGGRYGLQTMCEGGGMANATIIERLG